MTLVLASASPRRQELIRRVTEDFVVCPADVDEANIPYQTPAEYTLSMAVGKALAVSGKTPHPVLGADTVVCLGARIWASRGMPKKTGPCCERCPDAGIPCLPPSLCAGRGESSAPKSSPPGCDSSHCGTGH